MRVPEPTAITSTFVIGPTSSNSIHSILPARFSHTRQEDSTAPGTADDKFLKNHQLQFSFLVPLSSLP